MNTKTFKDQLNRTVKINFPPKRIISLVPSQTELLFDLGLNEYIVGITKFCIHPKDKFKNTTKIGGTKNLDLNKIRELKPDLIIGNKEENQKEEIEILTKEFPVWMSDIFNIDDAINMIETIGEMVDKKQESINLSKNILQFFNNISINENELKSTIYFIWQNPNMLAGQQTFINEMLKYCGLKNLIKENRYPTFSDLELKGLNPEVVFLSSEPYPFKEKHIKNFQQIWPYAKIKLVDGEMFSWYGSRLLKAVSYFQNLPKSF
ncbi:cobalamin-binding protein [Pedobacter psychrophilus]|uniref:Cobalamin-binding protein n=1 Tax=Pedobacter psychrophilus TaxID=1826909 RepID=A0A179DIF1_9SPHI|nr:helical backbone metal receptor [Pedobacter psychrophilus]OAQ40847.1 cobalamin-binding protein [Pedobacter psychrophilus]